MTAKQGATAPGCTWGEACTPCQFSGQLPVHTFEGRHYCGAHAPLDDPRIFNVEEMRQFISHQTTIGNRNFSGIVFCRNNGNECRFDMGADLLLVGCQFGAGCQVQVSVSADLSGAAAEGNIALILHYGLFLLCRATFAGRASLHLSGCQGVDLTQARFLGEVDLHGAHSSNSFDATDCVFFRAPNLVGNSELPQNTSFRGARFVGPAAFVPGSEARYRSIRNVFHKNRDREQEGVFYCYEKRALRRTLSLRSWRTWLKWRTWVARPVSFLYDLTTRYGQSYERALFAFILVQAMFGVIYSWMRAGVVFTGPWSPKLATFTISQVLRPFEVFAAHTPGGAYAEVYPGRTGAGWWAAATATHSVLSLSMVALFLLALRWRFRRD